MTKRYTDRAKRLIRTVWDVPGVRSVALQIVAKILIRVGLTASGAGLILSVGEAIGTSL